MVTPQLVEYIKNTLGRGYAEDKIRDALIKKGWKQADVDEAFRIARGATAAAAPPQAQPATARPQTSSTSSTPLGISNASATSSLPNGSPQAAQTPSMQTPPAQPPYTPPAQQPPATAIPAATSPRFQQPPVIPQQFQVFPQSPAVPRIREAPIFAEHAPGAAIPPLQTPLEMRSPKMSAGSQETGSLTGQTQASPTEETATPAQRSWKVAYVVGGVVVVLAAYVFFGTRYGLYAFGFNLFPFEDLAQKIGIAKTSPSPTLTPTPTPRQSSPATSAPTPTQTPALTPARPQVNGRIISVYGLESEAGSVGALAYSPDGQKVAYTRIADGQNLWVLNLANNSKESLLKIGQDGLPASVTSMVLAWSPDGAYVAVVGRGANGITNLYAIHVASKVALTLTTAASPAEAVSADPVFAPQWSADNSWVLAYVGQSLWKISRDGSQKSRITPNLPFGSFDWSRDDASITYTVKHSSEENVWVMQSDGKNYTQLTFGGVNQFPRFSPDGLLIAYAGRDAATSRDALWSMGRDGTHRIQLAVAVGSVREFAWSPDGKRIAFVERTEAGKQSLKMVQSDGSGLEEVLPAGEYEPLGFVSWSQDGSALRVAGSKKFLVSVAFRAEEFSTQTPLAP